MPRVAAHRTSAKNIVPLPHAIKKLNYDLDFLDPSKATHIKRQIGELTALQKQTQNMRDIKIDGVSFLRKTGPMSAELYDTVDFQKQNGNHWVTGKIPLHSRLAILEGHAIDLTQRTEDHGDHQHITWQSNNTQKALFGDAVIQIGQNQEGCPCCTAGLDFDEFAAAIDQFREQSQIQNSQGTDGHHHLVHAPDFTSPTHWGIFLGLSAPFGLVGLCAAVRNISGGLQNRKSIAQVIKGLDHDIQANTNPDVIQRLQAFRQSLAYSKFDADWNITVPGVLNGAASSLVLSTAVVAHPFALAAIGAYSTAQMGRNAFDFMRTLKYYPQLSTHTQSALEKMSPALQTKAYTGLTKATQIAQHKSIFYAANTANFAIFAAGALLTLLSIPALAVAGLGMPAMIGGLTMLTYGAAATGIGNNIWPRKFRPRNGDIRMDRSQLSGPDTLLAIEKAQITKQRIKARKKYIFTRHVWRKRWIKLKTALPETKDFFPKKIAGRLAKIWFFLPDTGSAAVSEKHKLNKAMVKKLHDSPASYPKLQMARSCILQQLAKDYEAQDSTLSASPISRDAEIRDVWHALINTKLAGTMLETWLNEGYAKTAEPHAHAYDHSHQSHKHVENTCCGHNHTPARQVHGITEHAKGWYTFAVEDFLKSASEQDKKSFLTAVDYHLFFVLRNTASYTERSLADFYTLSA